MRLKHLYLLLALVGTVLPYAAFLPFLRAHGLDLRLLREQLFGMPVAAFFGWDVILSSVVLFVLVITEWRRTRLRFPWAPIVANMLVGVSLALPLFLYLRESHGERAGNQLVR